MLRNTQITTPPMRNPFIQLLILLLAIQMSSCITTKETSYLQKPKDVIPAYKDSVPYKDYRLKEGDKLMVQVYSTDDKTNALFNGGAVGGGMQQLMSGGGGEGMDLYSNTIQSNGTIVLPLVGEVFVEGLTLREAKYALEEAVKPILAINSVDVRLLGKFFSIIGAGKSGRFPIMKDKINIFQAVALAGDFGFYADRNKVRIIRETKNGTIIKVFDVRSVDIMHSEFYYIEPNDVIYIEPLYAQFFGITTFWNGVSTVMTTFSFGLFVFNLLNI